MSLTVGSSLPTAYDKRASCLCIASSVNAPDLLSVVGAETNISFVVNNNRGREKVTKKVQCFYLNSNLIEKIETVLCFDASFSLDSK